MPIATVNPATGETLKTFDALERRARSKSGSSRAERAFRDLPHAPTSPSAHELLHRAADLLEADQDASPAP